MRDPKTVILIVTTDYQLRYHLGLEEELTARGFKVHVVSSAGRALDSINDSGAAMAHAIEMHRSPRPTADLWSLLKLLRLFREVKPSVILVGTPKASLLGLIAAMLTRVPSRIYELHGLPLEGASGLRRLLLILIERVTCSMATRVVPVGESLRSAGIAAGALPRSKSEVLGSGSPGGVDIERFERAKIDESAKRALKDQLGLSSDTPVIIFVGRITEDKGISILLQAMEMLGERAVNAQLLVVGPIDERSGIKSLAELGVGPNSAIVFTGEVQDIAPYMAIADVLCLPSLREGLPTVVLEAFAARVPVVATRATGTLDLVINEVTGVLVPSLSPKLLADGLESTLRRPQAAVRRVEEASRLVRDEFSQDVVRRRWADYIAMSAEESVWAPRRHRLVQGRMHDLLSRRKPR